MNDPSVSFGHFQIVPGQVATCIARSETKSSTRLSAKKDHVSLGVGVLMWKFRAYRPA